MKDPVQSLVTHTDTHIKKEGRERGREGKIKIKVEHMKSPT